MASKLATAALRGLSSGKPELFRFAERGGYRLFREAKKDDPLEAGTEGGLVSLRETGFAREMILVRADDVGYLWDREMQTGWTSQSLPVMRAV